MAPAAFADQIGDAAKKLGDASYDFAKEVDWNNGVFLQAPGIRALGGWARGLAVVGRVMFAWDFSLSNKIRICWAVDRIMYVYTDIGSIFWINSSSGSVCS